MKKEYETPIAEKIEFCYKEQVVASGGTGRMIFSDNCNVQSLTALGYDICNSF